MWSSILSFLTEVLRIFSPLFTKPSKQIAKVVNIYDSMHYIIENSSVERILILKSHNGGGLIKPDTPLYVTCLYEDYTHPLDTVKTYYQRMEVDEEYIRMLRDLSMDKILRVKTTDMKSGILKNAYTKDKIVYSEAHYIGQDRRNYYFCTLVSTKDTNFEGAADRIIISIGVNGIKNNIK